MNRVLFLLFLTFSSCAKQQEDNISLKNDSSTFLENANEARLDLGHEKPKDSLDKASLQKEKEFKIWLRDTLSSSKKYSFYNHDKQGVKSRKMTISSDSLLLDITLEISDTIFPNTEVSPNTLLHSTLLTLQQENVPILAVPFEIRIRFIDSYFVSYILTYDRSYSFEYLSIRPLSSDKETFYSLSKGNVTNTFERKYSKMW